jgi:hypothetical protein
MEMMGGQSGPSSIAYSYDTQGRVTQARRRIFNEEHIIETRYNDHGDKAVEITRAVQNGSENGVTNQRPGLPSYSEVRYSYRHDDLGNCTEQEISYRNSPDGEFQFSTIVKRTLTYY